MIPPFTELGLLPAGIHICTMAQCRAVFATNVRREQLFESLSRCVLQMHSHDLQGTLLIDGSFVTDKANPGDMEVAFDARNHSRAAQDRALLFYMHNHASLERTGIDWYPTVADGNRDFTLYFQYAGPKTAALKRCQPTTAKGILRLTTW